MEWTKWIQWKLKRAFDLGSCGTILLVGAPLLGVLAALVKFSSPGPIFFRQERVGLRGRRFRIFKFRTMRERPHHAMQWTAEEEAAVTSVGRFLRDYGLDELPQALNIVKGEMSVVGPRPLLPQTVEQWSEKERVILEVKPGVLSLPAICGRRSIPMEKRTELNIDYVTNWSLWLDVKILLGSALVVLQGEDARDEVVDVSSVPVEKKS